MVLRLSPDLARGPHILELSDDHLQVAVPRPDRSDPHPTSPQSFTRFIHDYQTIGCKLENWKQ